VTSGDKLERSRRQVGDRWATSESKLGEGGGSGETKTECGNQPEVSDPNLPKIKPLSLL